MCCNNIFKKCLNSKSKRKYYRRNIQSQVVKYYSNFLTELILLFGGIYMYLIYINSKDSTDEYYKKSIVFLNKQFDKIYDVVYGLIIKMYNEYYKSDLNLDRRKESRSNIFNNILIDIFKLMAISYKCFKELPIDELADEEKLEKIKNLVKKDDSINIDDVKLKFNNFRKNKNFDVEFQNMYNSLYAHRKNDTRSDVYKFILSSVVKGQKFDFNDIVDYVNLMCPNMVTEQYNVNYITSDKKWIRFLKENSSNQYYNNILLYISKFINL